MRLLQLTETEYKKVATLAIKSGDFVIVESQVFGQPSDFRYHAACSDTVASILEQNHVGRPIADNGRTLGFWQNCGGKGVLNIKSVSTLHFSAEVVRIVKQCNEAEIRFNAPTWKEILAMMPLSSKLKESMGLVTDTNRNNFSQVNLTSQI